jgi:DNA repair protein RecO (recombination protein O)
MIISTTGIVLYQSEYSETSLIIKAFTEQFGLQSYIVKGVRKKGARIKRNLFGPLSMIDLVAYGKENTGLHLIKEVSNHRQFNFISGDITRSSILLFMNELLYRSIRGEMPDKQLFAFIYRSVEALDTKDQNLALFPLKFALQLAGYLGFDPQNNYSEECPYFDMQEGEFTEVCPAHPYYLDPQAGKLLSVLLEAELTELNHIPGHGVRVALLGKILDYYRLHLPAFGEMNSHHILSTVLQDLEG